MILRFIGLLTVTLVFYAAAKWFFIGFEDPTQRAHYWFGFSVATFNGVACYFSGVFK